MQRTTQTHPPFSGLMSLSFYQCELHPLLGVHLPYVLGAIVVGYFEFPALQKVVAFLKVLNTRRCKLIGGEHEVNDYAKVLEHLLDAIKWYLPCDFDLQTFNTTSAGHRVPAHLAINCNPTVPRTINLEGPVRQLTRMTSASLGLHGSLLCQFAELVKDQFDGGFVERFEQLVEEDYEHQPPVKRAKKSIRMRGPCA